VLFEPPVLAPVLLLTVIAFVLVEGVVAWIAFRPVSLGGRRRLEVAWLATPALILVALVLWTGRVLGSDVRNVPAKTDLTVHVTGHMFYWQVRYELPPVDGVPREIEVAANQIHLPEGKAARIVLDAADVVHGFWVPQFRIKETIAPGSPVTIWMQPMETGEFNIVCAELCGESHFAMRGFVHVESDEAFAGWIAAQEKTPAVHTASVAR
jgi:cytochrome c oxidase subunit 2